MAVDTANKRYSMFLLAMPFGRVLPIPDGAIFDVDRQHYAFLYRGISLVATMLLALERGIMRRIHGRMFGRVN